MSRLFWLSAIVLLYTLNAGFHFIAPHQSQMIATIYLGLAIANYMEFKHIQDELNFLEREKKKIKN